MFEIIKKLETIFSVIKKVKMGKKLVFKCENLLPFYTENFLLLELHPPIINAGGLPKNKKIHIKWQKKSQLQMDVFPHFDY